MGGFEWYIRIGELGLKLFYLNLLWFFFSLLGLIIVGVFPATAAMFNVLRKLIIESEDTPIFKTFWEGYKTSLIKSNIIGYISLVIGFVLIIDIRVIQQLDSSILNQIITISLYVILVIYALINFYLFPIFSHYELKILEYFKYSIILVLAKPLQTVFLLLGFIVLAYMYQKISGLIPVFGISIFGFFAMKIASKSFSQKTPISDGN
ncbi:MULTISPECIES: YesL family protein [Paraliobacillus]|uniref:YesL family protein n=1 Tax=Paraliobacillus TaxID=200903 RepID=UPI000DD4E94F|nr:MULTISPECIES: DUF624 domain-containing protein [Paraliobacillus]